MDSRPRPFQFRRIFTPDLHVCLLLLNWQHVLKVPSPFWRYFVLCMIQSWGCLFFSIALPAPWLHHFSRMSRFKCPKSLFSFKSHLSLVVTDSLHSKFRVMMQLCSIASTQVLRYGVWQLYKSYQLRAGSINFFIVFVCSGSISYWNQS